MKLKKLELQGFKSFPDRTVLDFTQGATIVVGPNGSGKSNISDAIRWVLGETSAKGVRGTKMEDVIFGGSDSRKQMNVAEVSLILDNTGDGIIIPDMGDEIVVTRRCNRGGDSEYMIDRKPARLRDITELFMNTGLGKTGYSIIGQGKVAEIVSRRSEDRRTIFEEAAGISKFRVKKEESERKMESVSDNMTRISDILTELEARVGPLERDSEKAKKYLELYEEKKAADVSLWLYDVEDVRKKVNELTDADAIAKRDLDDSDSELSTLEARNEQLFDENQKTKLEYDRIMRELSANSEKRSAIDGNIRVTETEIEHLIEKRRNAETELSLHEKALTDSLDKNGGLAEIKKNQENCLAELKEAYEELIATADALRAERAGIEEQMARTSARIREKSENLVQDKIRLSEISGSRDTMESRKENLRNEFAEKESQCSLLKKKIVKEKDDIAGYQEQYDGIKAKFDKGEAEIKALNDEIETLYSEKNALVPDLTAKRQRAETLARMEEHFEGYNNSVKFVMDSSERGMIKGVLGPISKMIKVDAKYSVAVETALGANIQNIVVEDEAAAKSAIELLKRSNAGRATFYPITSIKAQPLNLDMKQMRSYRGYVGIASELTDMDGRCTNVIEYMLGRTVVFDNLANATDYSKTTGYHVRAVTLDGQLINAGGSFTGGSVKRDSGMLTRGQEIAKLEAEVEKLSIMLKAKDNAINEKTEKIAEIKEDIESISQNVTILETVLNAEATQLAVFEAQYESDSAQCEKIKNDLEIIEDESGRDNAESERIKKDIAAFDDEIRRLENENSESEEKLLAKNKEIVKATDSTTAQMIKITAAEKDIEATQNSIEQSNDSASALNGQIERDKEIISGATSSEKEKSEKLGEMRKEIFVLEEESKKLEADKTRNTEDGIRQDGILTKVREQIREISHKRENLFRAYTQLESQLENAKQNQDKLTAKLWEDYELTYITASELGYPPVTAETRIETAAKQTELKSRIKSLGSVNISAIDEYTEVKTRAEFMRGQYDDLEASRADLEKIISELETEMCTRFVEVMGLLDLNFKSTFRELFGGGSAELKLTDPDNPLTSGIDINVAPPGKIINSMSLLSGGEQSFVAIALFFAILNVNPTPFAVLDEIEAALDDVNVARFANYIKRYSGETQFICITHRRGTMEIADMLYGVTMPERGISRVLTLNIGEVESRLGVKIN